MKTLAETQPEVVGEQILASNIIRAKERNQRILYIILGVGIILMAFGFISFLIR